MALVMSVRAWRLHEQQGERLEELAETVEVRCTQHALRSATSSLVYTQ